MLSDEKISHMSHLLLRQLKERGIVRLLAEESRIRKQIKRSIVEELKLGEEIDEAVRRKLQSYSKKIVEGSPEWEVLYKRFFQEEEKKRGLSSE
jgi:hypothetical protein